MVAAVKLLHLLEAFSTPWFLFSAPSNHHLVFFLLEIFNNIIQYQFDGNANLVYTIIRKRHVFHALANLPSDVHGISKCLSNRKGPAPATAPTTAVATSPQNVANRVSPTFELRKLAASNAMNGSGDHESVKSLTPPPTAPSAPKVTTPTNSTAVGYEEDVSSDVETKSDLGEASMEGSRPALPAEPGTLKASLLDTPAIGQMTEREPAHPLQASLCDFSPLNEHCDTSAIQDPGDHDASAVLQHLSITKSDDDDSSAALTRSVAQRGSIRVSANSHSNGGTAVSTPTNSSVWHPTPEWVASWRAKLPLQTIMRLLQVLVPQVEKICIDK